MRAMKAARSSSPRSIRPARPGLDARVRVPGSKSVTNRALLLAGLAAGESVLHGALTAGDTEAFAAGLRSLGVAVERRGDDLHVSGAGGRFPAARAEVFCSEAGTAARFLLAAAAAGEGVYRFDAAPQLRRRPLGLLLDALRAQGARTDPDGADALPLTLLAGGLAGGSVRLPGDTSSQFVSALLMAAPLGRAPLDLRVDGLVSRPYVTMSLRMMDAFGAGPASAAGDRFVVAPGSYAGREYAGGARRLHGVLLLRRRGGRGARPGARPAPRARPAGRRRVPRRARVHGLRGGRRARGRAGPGGRPGRAWPASPSTWPTSRTPS